METENGATGVGPHPDPGGGVQLGDPDHGHILRGAVVDS